MADTKISALTAATTPLAGTEVLPIVQSGTTKQVSVANLTTGRTVTVDTLVITSGSLNLAGGGANGFISGNTWYGINSGNWVFQAGNASQSFVWANTSGTAQVTLSQSTGNLTFNTGNVVQGTAAKGINFTANSAAAGMTSQLLNWYEEGTWTPNQGAGLTVNGSFTSSGKYTRIGRQVTIYGYVNGSTNVAVSAGGVICTNAPYTSSIFSQGSAANGSPAQGIIVSISSATVYAAAAITASNGIYFTITYFV